MSPPINEEMMRLLFQSTRAGNKNVSGVLGNLDNPLLALIAGVYDPNTEMGATQGATPLLTKYSSSQIPAIQQVIASIRAGADPYQLEADIDALLAADPSAIAETGMSPETFTNLSKEMLDEATGTSSKKKPFWAQAGLPNPLELYNEQTVPLDQASQALIAGFREPQELLSSKLKELESRERSAKGRMREAKTETITRTVPDYGNIAKNELTRFFGKFMNHPGSLISKKDRPVTKTVTEKRQRKIDVTGKDYMDAQRAAIERGYVQAQLADQRRKEEAVRKGALAAYESAGRTPTLDAISQMMRFISNSK